MVKIIQLTVMQKVHHKKILLLNDLFIQ